MSYVKELALDIFEGREVAKKRIEKGEKYKARVEDWVEKIIKIFKISNISNEAKKLIWQVRLVDYRDRAHSTKEFENCLIMISFEHGEKAQFSNALVFDCREHLIGRQEELKQYIKNLEIPNELLENIIQYFKENLSEYFIAVKEDSIRFRIELKSNNY